VPSSRTLFGYPLMADASEVRVVIAPKPWCHNQEYRDRRAHS